MKKWAFMVSILSIVLSLIGCGGGAVSTTQQDTTPITLKVYQTTAVISDAEFQDYFVDPVKKKFPNITLELVRDTGNTNLSTLVGTNQVPDIIFTASNFLNNITQYNIPIDLTPLVKKYNMDISKFDKQSVDDLKAYSDKGALLAVPFSVNYSIMVYNKDIFDKFGAPYPTDGMTWDQVIALVKQVNRVDVTGNQFKGINPNDAKKFATQLSLPVVDPTTLQPVLTTDGWRKAFEKYKEIMDIQKDDTGTFGFSNQNLAMYTSYSDTFGDIEKAVTQGSAPANWDFVTMPSFPENPGVALRNLSHCLSISASSPNPDAAFKVIQYVTSPEVQTILSKRGIRFPAITDKSVRDVYASENQMLKGKNIQAAFKAKGAPNPKPTPYDTIAGNEINKAFDKVMKGMDINTALKQAQDAAAQNIATAKTQQ